MPRLNRHIDEFSLLRLAGGDVNREARVRFARHTKACQKCRSTFVEMKAIDRGLKDLAAEGLLEELGESPFPSTDPFSRRPGLKSIRPRQTRAGVEAGRIGMDAVSHGQRLVGSGNAGTFESDIGNLDLFDAAQRLGLLYALQERGRQITKDPLDALHFAEGLIRRLRSVRAQRRPVSSAEEVAPRELIWGQAHLLAAQARLWTREFDRAEKALRIAYRAFGKSGDEVNLAHTELVEAQRRSFTGQGKTGLALSRRAASTFRRYGLLDFAASALAAEGIALFDAGSADSAVRAFRGALPVFQRYGIWNAYVSTLNCLGTALNSLGRLDEARREYAAALRHLSLPAQSSLRGYLRLGLAQIVLSAGRPLAAARASAAASRSFAEAGLHVNALVASLLEIECWARQGDLARARRRLAALRTESSVDDALATQLEVALAGTNPDFAQLEALRSRLGPQMLTTASL